MNAIIAPAINSSFSVVRRNLQIAWDSTSLGAFKRCPRYYLLYIVEGHRSRGGNVNLDFGILLHKGKELFEKLRAAGFSHDEAVVRTVREIMLHTWDSKKKRPWQTNDSYKNRFTLVRSLVWYFEEYKTDVLKTIILANGKPAVELSFSFDTTARTRHSDETFSLCGHIDRLVDFNCYTYVSDVKSTKHELGERYYKQFTPHNQFSLYSIAPGITWHVPVKGIIVDAVQVQVGATKFGRDTVTRTDAQLQEWLRGFYHFAWQAESYAIDDFWPMNEESCDKYGGCPFRGVCSHSPQARRAWLAADFIRQPWDPLQVRE